MESDRTYSAFSGDRLIASGELQAMLLQTKATIDRGEADMVLIFEDQTGKQLDFDLRGTPDEVLARLPSHAMFAGGDSPSQERRGPGRPRLGVVSREVSLLPRHWQWLEQQSGGISATLRKLVEEARKQGQGEQRRRKLQDAAAKFMWTMAGGLPGFEEASRALYRDDGRLFYEIIAPWPHDIRVHIERLLGAGEPSEPVQHS